MATTAARYGCCSAGLPPFALLPGVLSTLRQPPPRVSLVASSSKLRTPAPGLRVSCHPRRFVISASSSGEANSDAVPSPTVSAHLSLSPSRLSGVNWFGLWALHVHWNYLAEAIGGWIGLGSHQQGGVQFSSPTPCRHSSRHHESRARGSPTAQLLPSCSGAAAPWRGSFLLTVRSAALLSPPPPSSRPTAVIAIESHLRRHSSRRRPVSLHEATIDIKLPRRSLLVQFTCNACGERTKRLINRVAYERGTIFLQCAGCQVYHKFVDNLGLVVEYDLREENELQGENVVNTNSDD